MPELKVNLNKAQPIHNLREDKPTYEELMKLNPADLVKAKIPNTVLVTKTHDDEVEPDMDTKWLVTHLNGEYILYGTYPPIDTLFEKRPTLKDYSPVGLKKLFDRVNKTLEEKRDCPPYQLNVKVEYTYDPEFIAACNIIMNPMDKRSITAKLNDIGVSTARWNKFLRVKKNQEFYSKLIDNMMDYDTYEGGRLALSRNVMEGDLPSIKYFNEMTGKFVASKDFDPRVLIYFMNSVLDVVSRYVDGSTARKIAEEMEVISIKELGMG